LIQFDLVGGRCIDGLLNGISYRAFLFARVSIRILFEADVPPNHEHGLGAYTDYQGDLPPLHLIFCLWQRWHALPTRLPVGRKNFSLMIHSFRNSSGQNWRDENSTQQINSPLAEQLGLINRTEQVMKLAATRMIVHVEGTTGNWRYS